MKVLFWSELFWPHIGGIEIFGEQLMEVLQPRGFEFAVVTSQQKGSPNEEKRNGIHIYRLPLREGLSGDMTAFRQSLQAIARIKHSFRPDLHHLNTAGPSFYYHLKTATMNPAPSLFTLHFFAPDSLKSNGTLEQMLKNCQWVNGVSQTTLDHTKRIFPFIEDYSSVIYNGLKPPPLAPTPLDVSSPFILAWGRLHPDKGFDLALKAFAQMAADFPQIRFQLAGIGGERENLANLAKQLGIAHRVDFLGYLPDQELFKAIQRARFVVVPSRGMECFGLAPLEAMQMARPVLGSRSGGMIEVIAHGISGWIVDQGNPAALEEGFRFFLTHPHESRTMGEEGYRRAKELFSLERMVEEYEKLYRRLGDSQCTPAIKGSF